MYIYVRYICVLSVCCLYKTYTPKKPTYNTHIPTWWYTCAHMWHTYAYMCTYVTHVWVFNVGVSCILIPRRSQHETYPLGDIRVQTYNVCIVLCICVLYTRNADTTTPTYNAHTPTWWRTCAYMERVSCVMYMFVVYMTHKPRKSPHTYRHTHIDTHISTHTYLLGDTHAHTCNKYMSYIYNTRRPQRGPHTAHTYPFVDTHLYIYNTYVCDINMTHTTHEEALVERTHTHLWTHIWI